MKTLFLAVLASVVLISPTFAGGQHGGGHGHNDKPSKPSHHDKEPKEKEHQHGNKKGPVGSPAQPTFAKKSIQVSLTDTMRINFKEDLKTIQSGTVIQFIVTNDGKIPHEFSIGNQLEQKEHAEMMRTMPGMVHSDGNTITVEPGKTRALTWHFDGDDLVVFACNIPGHYEAGMFKNVVLANTDATRVSHNH
jgi:uncharacterized cupredoxin-like copper-binding protein